MNGQTDAVTDAHLSAGKARLLTSLIKDLQISENCNIFMVIHMSTNNSDTTSCIEPPFFQKDGKRYIRLYYFMPSKHLFDVLKNDEIKVSLPEECNDPLEFVSAAQTQGEEPQKEARLDGGFISFSEKYDNSLMWSHYADSHRGVCLRFDFPIGSSGILENFEPSEPHRGTAYLIISGIDNTCQFTEIIPAKNLYAAVLVKVVYQEDRPSLSNGIIGGSFSSGDRLISLNLSSVFFCKAEEWKYEQEWRLMITPAAAEKFHDNAFFATGITKYLSGILLGKNYPESEGTTWAKIIQARKNNPHLMNIANMHDKIVLDRAAFHQTKYKIILPRIEESESISS